jgi:hypothetical protein
VAKTLAFAPNGHVLLRRLRDMVEQGYSALDMKDALTVTESELTDLLRDQVRSAANDTMRQREQDFVNEIRQLSAQLGEHQAMVGDMRAHIYGTREHLRELLRLLEDAWWLEAAAHYHSLAMLINDNTVRGI